MHLELVLQEMCSLRVGSTPQRTLRSLSITQTDLWGILDAKKYALELPITPPPTTTTSYCDRSLAGSQATPVESVLRVRWPLKEQKIFEDKRRAIIRTHAHVVINTCTPPINYAHAHMRLALLNLPRPLCHRSVQFRA